MPESALALLFDYDNIADIPMLIGKPRAPKALYDLHTGSGLILAHGETLARCHAIAAFYTQMLGADSAMRYIDINALTPQERSEREHFAPHREVWHFVKPTVKYGKYKPEETPLREAMRKKVAAKEKRKAWKSENEALILANNTPELPNEKRPTLYTVLESSTLEVLVQSNKAECIEFLRHWFAGFGERADSAKNLWRVRIMPQWKVKSYLASVNTVVIDKEREQELVRGTRGECFAFMQGMMNRLARFAPESDDNAERLAEFEARIKRRGVVVESFQ
jgi:hypothetical protein